MLVTDSSDHLILCPIELFTDYFMTIVLQLPGLRSDSKMPNTSVGVCRCLGIQVRPDSVNLGYRCPWLPRSTKRNHDVLPVDCDLWDLRPRPRPVDCRNNDLFAVVSRNRECDVQARWTSLQLAFTCDPRQCVPRVGHTGSKTSSRHSLLQWLEQEPLSCFDL